MGRWTEQLPKRRQLLSGLITGCRVTCESSHSIRNANGLLPFPAPHAPVLVLNRSESQTQSSPAPDPSRSPRQTPLLAPPCFAACARRRMKHLGSAAGEGAPGEGFGGSDPRGAAPCSSEPLCSLTGLDPTPGSLYLPWSGGGRALGSLVLAGDPQPRSWAIRCAPQEAALLWDAPGGRTWQNSTMFHVSNCN